MAGVETDPLILPIIARTDQMVRAVRGARAQFSSEAEQIKRASASMRGQLEADNGAVGNSFKRMAGIIATFISAREITGLVDGFTRIQNSLRVAGLEGEALGQVQDKLRAIAGQYGVELEALGQVYARTSMAQKDLGASTDDLIRLNEIIAAGLKVTGTSTQQASGALLQLGQALSAGTVRAEEFNSLLEGAPAIAQAAARGIDGFGGNVGKLRAAIAEGEITSKAFFQGVLKGGIQTIADAEKATMTLSGAFTVLRNELTLFVGDAAKSNGLVAAMSAGIIGLANNLDKVAMALTVIAVATGGRWVASLVASISATLAQAAATQQAAARQAFLDAMLQKTIATNAVYGSSLVRTTAATNALGVAAGVAGRSVLALFGGPVGLAITAFTLGVVAAANSTDALSKSVEDLEQEIELATAQAEGFEAAARKAGGTIKTVGEESAKASGGVDQLSASFKEAARRAEDLAKKSGLAALRMAQLKVIEAQDERQSVLNNSAQRRAVNNTGLFGRFLPDNAIKPTMLTDEEKAKLAALDQKEATYRRQIAALTANPNFGTVAFESETSGGGTGAAGKPKPKPKGRSGPSPEEIDARFLDELGRSNAALLAARAELTGAAQARYKAEIAALDEEMAAYRRQVALDENLSEPQRIRLIAAREAEMQERRAIAQQNLYRGEQEQAFDLFRAENEARQELLAGALEEVQGASDRRALQLRMLQLQRELEEAQLDLIIATKDTASAEHSNAVARKGKLNTIYGQREQGIRRGTEGPLESYARGLNRTDGQLRDQVEALVVDKLQSVEDGITDALSKAIGTKDPLITGLIRLLIQEVLMKPIANALSQAQGGGGGILSGLFSVLGSPFGGGGGGASSLFGGISAAQSFGRASGGYVAPRQTVRVNEQAGGVELLKMGSQGGKVIPLGQARAQRGGGMVQKVYNINISAENSVTPAGFAQGLAQQILAEAARMDAQASKATRRQSIGDQAYFQDTGNVR